MEKVASACVCWPSSAQHTADLHADLQRPVSAILSSGFKIRTLLRSVNTETGGFSHVFTPEPQRKSQKGLKTRPGWRSEVKR